MHPPSKVGNDDGIFDGEADWVGRTESAGGLLGLSEAVGMIEEDGRSDGRCEFVGGAEGENDEVGEEDEVGEIVAFFSHRPVGLGVVLGCFV